MKTSVQGAISLAGCEAIVLSRYLDAVHVWTYGVGHTAAASIPDPRKMLPMLTVKGSIDLLLADLIGVERAINKLVKVKLTQNEFDALVLFQFNTGGLGQSKGLQKLNTGDKVGAWASFGSWNKGTIGSKRVVLSALVTRRAFEKHMFFDGYYGDGMASLIPADANGKVLWSQAKRIKVSDHL